LTPIIGGAQAARTDPADLLVDRPKPAFGSNVQWGRV